MGLQWYPKYPGDYARKTKGLSMLEHGAFNLLLDHYYSTGHALHIQSTSNADLIHDHSRLYRICFAHTQQERDAVDYVLENFFEYRDGSYFNSRAEDTILKQNEKHTKRSQAANKRWNKQSICNASAKHEQPEPEPDSIKREDKSSLSSESLKEAVKIWNEMAGKCGLAQVQKLTDQRKSKLKARLNSCNGLEGWGLAVEKVSKSGFLLGDTGWRADFDFMLQEKSFTKLMEGAYDNDKRKPTTGGSASRTDQNRQSLQSWVEQGGESEN